MSGQLQNFHTSFHNLFVVPKGCSKSTKNALIQRFEHYKLAKNPYQSLHILGPVITLSLNILFSKTQCMAGIHGIPVLRKDTKLDILPPKSRSNIHMIKIMMMETNGQLRGFEFG